MTVVRAALRQWYYDEGLTWRRFACAAILGALLAVAHAYTTHAEPLQTPAEGYSGGFADLAAALGDGRVGMALTAELPGDEPDSVVQVTTIGAFYWSPQHAPTFTDGWRRAALTPAGLVEWDGLALDPPQVKVAVGSVWGLVKACETPGLGWDANTGNSFYGGLQENAAFWSNYGGLAFAARPDQATPDQQIVVAERGLAQQGWLAWPWCSRHLGLR